MRRRLEYPKCSLSLRLTPRARVTKKLLVELGLVDVWRVLHPTDKQFPFYSASQVAYSRIDNCFVHNSDRHRLTDGQIGAREIFDHSPVYLTMHLDNKKDSLWQLNTSILNDSACKEYIQKELRDYIDNNNNGEVSPSVLWDASKSVIRGKLIALTSHKKKGKP